MEVNNENLRRITKIYHLIGDFAYSYEKHFNDEEMVEFMNDLTAYVYILCRNKYPLIKKEIDEYVSAHAEDEESINAVLDAQFIRAKDIMRA